MVSAKLGDLVNVFIGGDAPKEYTKEKSDEKTVPIYSNGVEQEGLYGYTDSPKVEGDSVTISARGNVGAAFYRAQPFVPIVRLLALVPNRSLISAKYLFYLLKLDSIISTGAAQQQITAPQIKKHRITYFSDISYQNRIASILSAYDNLIENNNRRINLLEQMAENLYKECFVRFRFPGHENVEMENGLPQGWKIDRVKSIVKRLPFNRTYKEDELEKAGNVVVIDQSTNDVLGYHNNEPSHYADYNNPLIIFGDHSCKCQLMTQNFSLGENVIPFTTLNRAVVNGYWLFYATHKLIKTEEYKRHWGRFSTMKVLIPEISLQNKFADIIVNLEKEKNKLKAENDTLIRQRDLLLPRLMSGKLEVNA